MQQPSLILKLLLLLTMALELSPPSAHAEGEKPSAHPLPPSLQNPDLPFRFFAGPKTRLMKVLSLAESGPGTLRECASQQGPRICLFEVGGVISLASPITVRSPELLIAGETAPTPGVTLTGSGIRVEAPNVEVRHISIRPGDGTVGAKPMERDGVTIGAKPPLSVHHVTLDHLSLTWALDENVSTAYETTRDVAVINSIIAEGLHRSIHPKGPHSKGVMIGPYSQRVLLEGNLIALNEERNPYLRPGASAWIRNNVIYGWGPGSPASACNLTNNDYSDVPVSAVIVGNVFIPGPKSFPTSGPIYAKRLAKSSQIYLADNLVMESLPRPHLAEVRGAFPPGITLPDSCPFPSGCTALHPASQAELAILATAGSRPAERGAVDRRIVSTVRQRTGDLKDCLRGCRRAAGTLDSITPAHRPLVLPARPFGDDDDDGESNIGEWLTARLRAVENRRSRRR